MQPPTPGRLGQVQAGAGSAPGVTRCSTSCVSARSVTQVIRESLSVHTPLGARSPELNTGDAGSGLPWAGRPRVSTRSSLPASDPGAAPSPPASPVATSSEPSTSTPSAPPLSVEPRGIPTSTGSGGSPGGDAHHPVVLGVVT